MAVLTQVAIAIAIAGASAATAVAITMKVTTPAVAAACDDPRDKATADFLHANPWATQGYKQWR